MIYNYFIAYHVCFWGFFLGVGGCLFVLFFFLFCNLYIQILKHCHQTQCLVLTYHIVRPAIDVVNVCMYVCGKYINEKIS